MVVEHNQENKRKSNRGNLTLKKKNGCLYEPVQTACKLKHPCQKICTKSARLRTEILVVISFFGIFLAIDADSPTCNTVLSKLKTVLSPLTESEADKSLGPKFKSLQPRLKSS